MNDSQRLVETVDRFCRFMATLPEDALREQDWGPREVLAHLVYHHELYVTLVERFLAGVPTQPPNGPGRRLNAAAVAASQGLSLSELVERFQKANRRLMGLYRRHNPDDIVVEIRAGAKLRTLAELIPLVEAHIRNHLAKLRKSLTAGAERRQVVESGAASALH
jgi:hypothetical protein